jgi:hypothetical protein
VSKEICRLGDVVRRKLPEKSITNSWFLLHSNAPVHRSVLVMDFLAKNNVTTLKYPPYSPDLTPADFLLLPRPKSASKGRHFCGTTDAAENATEELKRLSQNGFQERSHHLYSHWHKCTAAQEEYSEGNVAYMFEISCISQKLSYSGNILKVPRIRTLDKLLNVAATGP